jgi:hypothetical protein
MLAGIAIAPVAAFAEGSVKVECNGRCDLVTVGQVCDSFSVNSIPVAIACDDTAVGAGTSVACGGGSVVCRPFGSIFRSDRVSDYCDDGGGFDAVITCRFPTVAATAVQEPIVPKVDDGAGDRK